jgi:hypothetical protein
MNEKMINNPTPEEMKLRQEQQENERCAQFEKDHSELFTVPDVLRECGSEVVEFEAMIVSFESIYPLKALHEIVDLTLEEALTHPIRQPAKEALGPIVAKLHTLEEETDISSEKFAELKAQYRRLSQAVGMLNNNKLDHTR